MDSRLAKLIRDYQRRVVEAVAMMESAGIARPQSTHDWVAAKDPGRITLPTGFSFYKHGFGCSVDGAEWGVDFDFGEQGQIDGFDAWRLYDFARRRLSDYCFASEEEIRAAVLAAAEADELSFSGYILYYLNEAGRREAG
jgi:hypothetical protein